MAFRGWPAEAIEFFEGLEADNTKTYWETHKDVYQHGVRAPMDELLDDLAPVFGPGKVYRPYRDVRFSKDKSPYKTNIAASVGEWGHVSVSAEGLGVGSGVFHMAPDQLDRYRRAVAGDETGAPLADVVAGLLANGSELVGHGVLKTAPKGYARDHPRVELLRWKGLAAWRQWAPAAWLGTAKAKGRIVGFLEEAEPLNRWLATCVGESTFPPPGR